MKTIRFFTLLSLFLMVATTQAEYVTVTVSGHVFQSPSLQPYANHQVNISSWWADYLYPNYPKADSVFTDAGGFYSFTTLIPFYGFGSPEIEVSTLDCELHGNYHNFYFSGSVSQFVADFYICNNSVVPPGNCQNYITGNRVTGYYAYFGGGLYNPPAASYSWDFGDGSTSTYPSPDHWYSSPGTYQVSLTTQTNDGCLYTTTEPFYLQDTVGTGNCNNYIIVNSIQGLNVSMDGGMVNQQSASYTWNFGDGTTGTGTSLNHLYTSAGTYLVSLSTLTSGGCANVNTLTLQLPDTIYPLPCDNYFYEYLMQSYTENFQGYMTYGQSASYSWNFGDGSSATGQSAIHSYGSPGSYNVSLTTYTSDSCTYTSTQTIIMLDTISNLPCDNYITIWDIQGLAVSVLGRMVNQQNANYYWDFGDGMTGYGDYVTHTYPSAGTYNLELTTVTNDGCTDSSFQAVTLSDSIPAGCNSYFTVSAGPGLYEIHLEATTTSPYPTIFQWDFGDQTSGTGQSVNHTYAAAGNYLVVMNAVDTAYCTSIYYTTVAVYMFGTNTLNGRVYAGITTTTDCQVQLYGQEQSGSLTLVQTVVPDSANYYIFSAVPSGFYRILAFPDPGTSASSLYLPTYYGDTYLWENANAIMLGYPQNPYDIHLVAYDSIGGGVGSITGQIIAGGKTVLLANQEVLLFNEQGIPVRWTFTNAQGYYSFGELPYGNYEVHPNMTGINTVPVYVQLSPGSPNATVNMTVHGNTVTGIPSNPPASLLTELYPNPVTGLLFYTLNAKEGNEIIIEILNASGIRAWVGKEVIFSGSQVHTIDVSQLARGIYFLRLINSQGKVSGRKFVKD